MAVNPRDMDGFMPLLSTTDIKKKLNVGNALLNYLGDFTKSIECQDIGIFVDNVIPWLSNGNPKVSDRSPGVETTTPVRAGLVHCSRAAHLTFLPEFFRLLCENLRS